MTSGMLGPGCVEEGWQDSPYERKVTHVAWNKNKMALFRMVASLYQRWPARAVERRTTTFSFQPGLKPKTSDRY
jgi:hypothetical protein